MKIKQTTLLILMLTMLVLSTSCGKSPSVNSNLPTPKSNAANLNQDLIPEESFSIYKWIKNHLLWTTTAVLGATYVGFNEWRHFKDWKAMKATDTKATNAKQDAGTALETANGLNNKVNEAWDKANASQNWAVDISSRLEKHASTENAHKHIRKPIPIDIPADSPLSIEMDQEKDNEFK